MFSLAKLWADTKANPRNPINKAGRLMGRHCRARLARAIAKRVQAGKTPFNPR
jgi:uncharacterized protein YlaI